MLSQGKSKCIVRFTACAVLLLHLLYFVFFFTNKIKVSVCKLIRSNNAQAVEPKNEKKKLNK